MRQLSRPVPLERRPQSYPQAGAFFFILEHNRNGVAGEEPNSCLRGCPATSPGSKRPQRFLFAGAVSSFGGEAEYGYTLLAPVAFQHWRLDGPGNSPAGRTRAVLIQKGKRKARQLAGRSISSFRC